MRTKLPKPKLNKPLLLIVPGTLLLIALALTLNYGAQSLHRQASPISSAAVAQHALSALGNVPLAFEPNQGQSDPQVKYMARGAGYTLFLTSNQAVLSLGAGKTKEKSKAVGSALRISIAGANRAPEIAGEQKLPGISNYFLGNDPSRWQTNVPQFSRATYRGVYPGIDLAFHGAQKQAEFDFMVSSGANPQAIALKFSGARQMKIDDSGTLVLTAATGDVHLHKPVAYQEENGTRQPVDASFVLTANHQVKFALGNYDRSRQLVIDPSVSYATYIGGGSEDQASSIAVDSSGNAYITGEAGDNTFPHSSGTFAGGTHDAYVFKLDPTGTTQVYSTLIGGSGDDSGNAIALDPTGNGDVYIGGGTNSVNFPATSGVFQTSLNGALNAFVAKLNASGTVIFATYLGGNGSDFAAGIAADSSGNIYVSGQTTSHSPNPFPTTSGAYQTALAGNSAAFVTVLNSTATSPLTYSTYLGGSGTDNATALALDSSNKIYIAGDTIPGTGAAFPTTAGAFQTTNGGGADAFVAKFDPTKSGATSLVYSTFLGGSAADNAYGIAVDTSNNAYVTGFTMSPNFPKTSGVVQSALAGTQNAFVTKLNSSGSALGFSTYLGGSTDTGLAIALDSGKTGSNVYVTGQAGSTFPLASPTQPTFGGGTFDAFVSQLNSTASSLMFSTYLGGSGQEDVVGTGLSGGIAVDGSGNIYVVGDTASTDFPKTAGSFQTSYGGGTADAFAAKISTTGAAGFGVSVSPTSATVTHGNSAGPFTATVTPSNGFSGTVTLTCSGLPTGAACGFNPATVANGNGTSSLNITTTARAAALKTPRNVYFAFLLVPGLALLGAGLNPNHSRRKKFAGFLLGCLLFCGIAFLGACGGSGGGGGGGNGGTPPGTYSVVVSGTASGVTATSSGTISLTVQ